MSIELVMSSNHLILCYPNMKREKKGHISSDIVKPSKASTPNTSLLIFLL